MIDKEILKEERGLCLQMVDKTCPAVRLSTEQRDKVPVIIEMIIVKVIKCLEMNRIEIDIATETVIETGTAEVEMTIREKVMTRDQRDKMIEWMNMIEGSIRETIEIVVKVRVIEETVDQGMIIEIHLEMIGWIMTETVTSLIGIMTDNEVETLIEEIGMVIGIEGDRIQ